MSERLGSLNIYGDEVEVNDENVSLWEHRNEPELDHVYVKLPERYNDGEQRRAFYLWKHIGQSAAAFALFREAIMGEPLIEKHLAIPESQPADREEYSRVATREIENADWDDPKLW